MVRQTRNGARWQRSFFAATVFLALILVAVPVWAQSALSTIHGTVKDESGRGDAGRHRDLSSPALQMGQIAVVSEADGNYRVGELPAGLYQHRLRAAPVSNPMFWSDFRLTIGFVARVDASMGVGGLEETITVTGASPGGRHDVDHDQRQPDVRKRSSRCRAAAGCSSCLR